MRSSSRAVDPDPLPSDEQMTETDRSDGCLLIKPLILLEPWETPEPEVMGRPSRLLPALSDLRSLLESREMLDGGGVTR